MEYIMKQYPGPETGYPIGNLPHGLCFYMNYWLGYHPRDSSTRWKEMIEKLLQSLIKSFLKTFKNYKYTSFVTQISPTGSPGLSSFIFPARKI